MDKLTNEQNNRYMASRSSIETKSKSSEKAYFTSTFKEDLMHNQRSVDINDNIVPAEKIILEDMTPEFSGNNGVIQFLEIEKREKSIIELGGTKEQQAQLDLGKLVIGFTKVLTQDEILQALKEASAKKKGHTDKTESKFFDKNLKKLNGSMAHTISTKKQVESDNVVSEDNLKTDSTEEVIEFQTDTTQNTMAEAFVDESCQSDIPLENYIFAIDKSCSNSVLLNNLLREFSPMSSYVAIQIAGNEEFRKNYGFKTFTRDDLQDAFDGVESEFAKSTFRVWLHYTLRRSHCPFKKMTAKPLSAISFDEYKTILSGYQNKHKKDEASVDENCRSDIPLENYIFAIDKSCSNSVLLNNLFREFSPMSSYVAIQIAGNEEFRKKYGFKAFTRDDLQDAFDGVESEFAKSTFRGWLHYTLRRSHCPFKKMTAKPLSAISFDEYKTILSGYQNKPKKKKRHNKVKMNKTRYSYLAYNESYKRPEDDKLYENFEYGLSDW